MLGYCLHRLCARVKDKVMKRKITKLKKCRECQSQFIPITSLHVYCSVPCSVKGTQKKREEKEARAWAVKKKAWGEDLKTHSDWIKEVQKIFNEYIRLRDKDLGCVSCGVKSGVQFHAGHYRTTSACPELRFNELNVWKQCAQCNNFLSGNLISYRFELVQRIGVDKVEWLEGKHEPTKYSIPELIQLKVEYRKKIKALQSA